MNTINRNKIIKKGIIILILIIMILNTIAPIKIWAATVFKDGITFSSDYIEKSGIIPYYEYVPSSAEKSDSVPLIVWLHGADEIRRR